MATSSVQELIPELDRCTHGTSLDSEIRRDAGSSSASSPPQRVRAAAEKALAGFHAKFQFQACMDWTICMYILGHSDRDVNERGLHCSYS